MITHTGKIGRLYEMTRHALGERIENGDSHKSLVAWLNGLPEVHERLKLFFEGRPITEQNLSEWIHNGGHRAWVRLQETRDLAIRLTEDANTLEEDTDGDCLSDRLAVMVTAELGRLMSTLLEEEKDPEKRWSRLKEMHRELSQLRRDDHRALRARIERKKREKEEIAAMNAETKRMEEESKSKLIRSLTSPLETKALGQMLGAMGYGDMGEKVAELAHLIKTDQPWKEFADKIFKDDLKNQRNAGPTKSTPQSDAASN